MNRLSLPSILLLLALLLAPWLGGRIWLEPNQGDGLVSFAGVFISRTEAAWGQLILSFLVFGAVVWAGLRRSVLQVPSAKILGTVFLSWFFMALAVLASHHKHVSLLEFARWTCMYFTVIAATAVLGRDRGARFALGAIVIGTFVVALTGISEFIEASRYSPNWRIFAGWQNPNAAAGMFALALPLAAGFVATAEERTERLLSALAFAVIGAALWLTASKGGLLSCLVGLAAYGLLALFQRNMSRQPIARVLTVVAIAAVFTIGISKLAAVSGGTGAVAGSRLTASSTESAQSFEFRKRLWSDAMKLAGQNPVTGAGLGAFSIEIKKVTSTQGSVVAHNSLLQLAAESGFFAAVSIAFAFLIWLALVAKKHPGVPVRSNVLRCAVVGSVLAGLTNSLVESAFSYFGWALCFFALLGVGLLLAVDGVVPERAPAGSRVLGIALVSAAAFSYLVIGTVSDARTRAGLDAMNRSEGAVAEESLVSATQVAPTDPVPPMQLARLYLALGKVEKAVDNARIAVSLSPTSGRFAILAESYAKQGKHSEASDAYEMGASLDPSNPAPLRKHFEFLKGIHDNQASKVAKQLVKMEASDFYKLSAIPWLVPTETISAREYLAEEALGSRKMQDAADMLEGAARILRDYRKKTLPELQRLTGFQVVIDAQAALEKTLHREPTEAEVADKLGLTQNEYYDWVSERKAYRIAGESLMEADEKTEKLRAVLQKLASVYRALGEASRAAACVAEAAELK